VKVLSRKLFKRLLPFKTLSLSLSLFELECDSPVSLSLSLALSVPPGKKERKKREALERVRCGESIQLESFFFFFGWLTRIPFFSFFFFELSCGVNFRRSGVSGCALR
jgi:hypothetical protein